MAPPLASVIEDIGYGWAQLKLIFYGGGVYTADGAELLLLGAITNALRQEWNLSPYERGLVVSAVFLGVFAGNGLSGPMGDLSGRRIPILVSYLGVFVASMVSTCAWSFLSLAAFRFFVGLSFGIGQPAWNAMGSELTPLKCRLCTSFFSQIMFACGEIYSAGLIYEDDPQMKTLHWRWLVAMGAVPSLVLLACAYFFLPESPFYLAMMDRKEEARRVLQSFARSNCRPDVPTDFQVVAEHRRSRAESWQDKISVIFGKHLLLSTIVMIFSMFNLNFLFYGGLYAFPQVLPEVKLLVYPATNLFIGALSEIPGLLLGVLVGSIWNRKNTMLIFCLSMVVSLSCFLHGLRGGPVVDEVLFQFGYIGFKMVLCVGFIVVFVYCTEIYPTSCRATGSAVCLGSGRVGALLCPLVYEWLNVATGSFTTFFFLMIAMCVINMVLIFILPYETDGKALPEDLAATASLFNDESRTSSKESLQPPIKA